MADDTIFRRLRGAIGNGLVWGACWSALWILTVAVFTVLGLIGIIPGFSWQQALGGAIRFGIAFGVIGFVAGGAFSAVIRVLYHGRRLSEIGWVRFGIGGGIVAGLVVPAFLQTMNWLSGDGLVPWELVLDDALLTAVFGGVAAGVSIRLAQRADPLLSAGSEGADSRDLGGAEQLELPGEAAG